ncbi:MAG: DNA alkylation repair protein [Holosporaceae bacterium]|jgi:3-methyladenine DNA glycosylase AlkD|nr:DNA alkylation repair protein [Holosporaceae bacterium]
MIIDKIIAEIRNNASEDYAIFHRKLIRAENGYGKGDIVIGCRVPLLRKISQKYCDDVSTDDLLKLLRSEYHEARALALIIMLCRFRQGKDDASRHKIVDMYLSNTKFINNWDLVDISCSYIIGVYFPSNDPIFEKLSESSNLWENRIAMVSTHNFIRQNDFVLTLRLCEKFMKHQHHLIHKACGWMLREIGKRNEKTLIAFLSKHHKRMPRIMLSYANERLKMFFSDLSCRHQ